MHSSSLCQFCGWNDVDGALLMLDNFDDIDIMYDDGAIIQAIMFNNQSTLLKASLDYFENKQFPIKDSKYEEASKRLIETLENCVDSRNSEIATIVSEYIGSDIAILHDVDESLSHSPLPHSTLLVSATVSKFSNIEDSIAAAKIGDANLVREYLDLKNHAQKMAVISAAIHNTQDGIVDTVMDMAPGAGQKATILRMAGDICAQSSLFSKAEEYYNKSLTIHSNYYVTYSKKGALYQQWSQDPSMDKDKVQKVIIQNQAIKNYDKALELRPKHIKYHDVQERLDIVSKQLKHLQLEQYSQDNLNIDIENDMSELLSYVSDEDDNTSPLQSPTILGQARDVAREMTDDLNQ